MFDKDELAQIQERRRQWESTTLRRALATTPETVDQFSAPEVPTKRLYTPEDIANLDYEQDLGFPGEYPYTRGIQPTMYRGRLWTMGQYAGYGMPEETNRRFKLLLEQGMTRMLIAYDLPTQLGYDSDDPHAQDEVGVVGMACPSLKELETLFEGIPLDKVTPVLVNNAAAQVALAQCIAVAEKQGIAQERLGGTTQNDILKEFIARGNYIFPPKPSLRLTVDIIEYCTRHMPRWNFSNFCGIHIREAGSTLVQELAFALADAITYVEATLERGLDIDEFAPRISFNFAASTRFLEEAAKFRAARRLWAKLMKERFGARKPTSLMFRTGTGSPGSTLTAQQPENNIVRVTLHTLASVLGGCQALHTAAMDEALALPTEKSATLALRTQQVVAYESGLAEVIDPLGGSYYIEALTDEIEQQVTRYLARIDEVGGMLRAIETGWTQREIAEAAYRHQREVEGGRRTVVGVNQFASDEKPAYKLHRLDPQVAHNLKSRLAQLKRERDNDQVQQTLNRLKEAAHGEDNLMPFVLEAVRSYATVGEVCGILRSVFGEYKAPSLLA